MTLIKSVSGMRGTIGGRPGEGLTPIDIVQLTAAYADVLREEATGHVKIVVGRDGRVTGQTIADLVVSTLQMCGAEVIQLGLTTTPTVSMYVPEIEAHGGIMISASHNPMTYNALKFFDQDGAFISPSVGRKVIDRSASDTIIYADVTHQGTVVDHHSAALAHHVRAITVHPLVDIDAIKQAGLHVAIDAINSTGSIAIPALLDACGVRYDMIHADISGTFAHNPEPLADHLDDLTGLVQRTGADLGVAVDPDVDRLAFITGDGSYMGEEYTLVAIADYVLQRRPGAVVSNLSSTRALRDVAMRHGQEHHTSKVGEYHVVQVMKSVDATLGGEGNGGIILPDLHYGRDALIGIALMLSYIARSGRTAADIRSSLPNYVMHKSKMAVDDDTTKKMLLDSYLDHYMDHPGLNATDGIKIDFDHGWVHVRQSNTEPILRIYSEAASHDIALKLADEAVERLMTYA